MMVLPTLQRSAGFVLGVAMVAAAVLVGTLPASAQSSRPRANDAYRPPEGSSGSLGTLQGPTAAGGPVERQALPAPGGYSQPSSGYGEPPVGSYTGSDGYRAGPPGPAPGYSEPYDAPRSSGYDDRGRAPRYERSDVDRTEDPDAPREGTYSRGEISEAGHRFFGSVSKGLASVIEYAFKRSGRPNGYILGEDVGGAFIGGLRYGEGRLYTKDAGTHKVYWQGPSLGYDFGGEGAKTMVLVYNLRDPAEIYERFGGVEGSAYFVGGVSIQFQKHGDVVLAPIRAGVGLRLGANIGYLKYTRRPTWNPF